MEKNNTVVILGAGAAGLTAAYELLKKEKEIKVILIDKNSSVGGMCRSINYKNNLIDIGGHRYFTKFENVKKWWLDVLPLQTAPAKDDVKLHRKLELPVENEDFDPQKSDGIMLKRYRYSRIYYGRHFFDYPVKLNLATIRGLGLCKMIKIFFSYLHAKIFPIKPEKTAEDFLTNQFGKVLYETFFKNYTEKLWGIECKQISSEWGRERIRGIKFWETVLSLFKSFFVKKEIVLDSFLYPKFGPGQVWDKIAKTIIGWGAEIKLETKVVGIETDEEKVKSVKIESNGKTDVIYADYVISSLPIKDLFSLMNNVPNDVKEVSDGLVY